MEIRHGQRKTRLYHVWISMKQRCYNPNAHGYENYGGRGIKVCDEWVDDFGEFSKWAYSTGYDASAKRGACTIDRVDNDGSYSPENCRWADRSTQQNNKRSNHRITHGADTKTITQWAASIGLSPDTVNHRVQRGLDVERIISPRICKGRERL